MGLFSKDARAKSKNPKWYPLQFFVHTLFFISHHSHKPPDDICTILWWSETSSCFAFRNSFRRPLRFFPKIMQISSKCFQLWFFFLSSPFAFVFWSVWWCAAAIEASGFAWTASASKQTGSRTYHYVDLILCTISPCMFDTCPTVRCFTVLAPGTLVGYFSHMYASFLSCVV